MKFMFIKIAPIGDIQKKSREMSFKYGPDM